MNLNKLKLTIQCKIDSVIAQNKRLLQVGERVEYTNNCNFLRGVSFVMSRLNKINGEDDDEFNS